MAIFHSYVRLPEATRLGSWRFHQFFPLQMVQWSFSQPRASSNRPTLSQVTSPGKLKPGRPQPTKYGNIWKHMEIYGDVVYSLVLFVPLLSLYQELWSFFKHGGPLILAIQIWPRIGKTWPESQSLPREPVRLYSIFCGV